MAGDDPIDDAEHLAHDCWMAVDGGRACVIALTYHWFFELVCPKSARSSEHIDTPRERFLTSVVSFGRRIRTQFVSEPQIR